MECANYNGIRPHFVIQAHIIQKDVTGSFKEGELDHKYKI